MDYASLIRHFVTVLWFVDIVHVFSLPLVVEVWQRDQGRSENSCIGVVKVPLSAVLKSPRMKFLVSVAVCN